jgi:hypothetical protein
MDIHPAGSPVILSPVESLSLSEDASRRFPYATAYLGFQVVLLGLLIFPGFALSAIHDTWARLIIQFVLYTPILFLVFRWAINKHILPFVSPPTNDLADYGKRFSLRNPFLVGFVAYWAMTRLTLAVFDPITKLLTQQPGSVGVALSFLIQVVVGYPPFAIAIMRVVLRPYRAKRLLPMLGLIFVLALSISFAISLAESRQEWAFRNHLYCEVLKPGMTRTEVDAGLGEYDLSFQLNLEHEFEGPGAENVSEFTMPRFKDRKSVLNMELVLGYDSADKLMMVGQWDLSVRDMTYLPVECPLPFLQ